MTTQLACLEQVALLRASLESAELVDAFLCARGAYLPPSSRLLLSSRHPSAPAGDITIAFDCGLPVGPQIDLLQLSVGKEVLPHAYMAPPSLSSVTTTAANAHPQPIGPTAKANALQSVKCALFFRYRHVRDMLSLSAAEESALAGAAWEKRADLASAMGKLFGRDTNAGVPIRVLALVGNNDGPATPVIRQSWIPFSPPATSHVSEPPLSPTSAAGASSAPSSSGSSSITSAPSPAGFTVTLTDAILSCLQIATLNRPSPTATDGRSSAALASVCLCGHVMAFPGETDECVLFSSTTGASPFLSRLLMPDGFLYVAFKQQVTTTTSGASAASADELQ